MGAERPLPDSAILTRLRLQTRDLHKRVEARPLMAGLLTEGLTPLAYVTCLLRLEAFHAALEPGLTAHLATIGDLQLSLRRKTAALRRDLDHFGYGPADPLPPIVLRTAAEAWGALYVIEGASLGAMVITRQLSRHVWLADTAGRSHFASYGAVTGLMWTAFRTVLVAAAGGSDGFADLAVAGACETFLRLDEGLKPVG